MPSASPSLARAALEYRRLIDWGYSPAASLKLVGDRHQLGRDERVVLFRGVSSSEDSEARARIIASPSSIAPGLELLVDGYNQTLIVMHYLLGRPLFIGTDGLTRDAGGSHGRIADQGLFERSAGILADRLAAVAPERAAVYLDSPVPGSAGHAALFRRLLAERRMEATVLLERSADFPLKAAAFETGALIASGDSAIADALAAARARAGEGARIYDAARWAIELAFGPAELLDLGRLVPAGKDAA
jgi:hypothetical protein